MVLDAEAMGLEGIRVNDVSTTFMRPKNYISYIVGAAVFVREKSNTPMGEVYPVKIADLGLRLNGVQQATIELYTKTARMSCRQLITNGMYDYYIEMILPHPRLAGTLRIGETSHGSVWMELNDFLGRGILR